ncbi:hypothetical protein O7627_26055 [Solwaraspora sp. WMMD1047]|uniref:hypothetical protein n=1 Tax=Solwaraspora sp. WMMD1047 TaxID=3016102 RepID=UPI0024165207|nr:hypothetical protein [Solwaraspora sp. WMMD1047]MDG4832746.1 hypothetical protein [Solwaraspora sp. WMMD1047]
MPEPQPQAGQPGQSAVPPGPPVEPARPEPTRAEPTRAEPAGAGPADPVGAKPDEAPPTRQVPPRWTGSAAVPPPTPKRRRWRGAEDATAGPVVPPPRDPTLHLPADELHDPETRTPVDPWAGADAGLWAAHQPYSPAPPLPPTRHFPGTAVPHSPAPPHSPVPSYPAQRSPAPPYPAPHQPAPQQPAPHHRAYPPPAALPAAPARPASVGQPAAPAQPGREAPRRPRWRGRGPAGPAAGGPAGWQAGPGRSAPPGWRPPPGYVPAPPRRRRTWPGVMLTLTLLTVACCCGVPAYFGKPMWEQYPASASLPAEVADLQLRDDAASGSDAQRLAGEMRAAHLFAEDTFAGVYSAPGNKRITVFGATGFRFSPESDVEAEMTRLGEQFELTGVQAIETGIRGEYQRCGTGRIDGTDVVVCAWADHGSIAAGVFTRLSVEDSARLLAELRTWIVQRG